MHHPYRFMHESPEQTLQNLGTYIKHVHIKDSVLEDGKLVYRLMGDGDLPIDEMMRALRSINYEGYVTLEWVRYWSRNMYDAGVVFPQFLHYMEAYLTSPSPTTSSTPRTRASATMSGRTTSLWT